MVLLSQKHGVNPAIPKCFYCQEDKNEIILAGKLRGDAEAPRGCVWDMEPCQKCRELMDRGVILISVTPESMEQINRDYQSWWYRSGHLPKERRSQFIPNPYRTGRWFVLSDDAVRRIFTGIFTGAIVDGVLRCRWTFINDDVLDQLGLTAEIINKMAQERG